MSSKLVKKQLSSILNSAEKSQITSSDQKTKRSKTGQKTLKKQQKKAKQKQGPSTEAIRRANLQYFSKTAKPAAATQDLLAQALRSRGAVNNSAAAAAPVDNEDDYVGSGVDDGFF